MLINFILLGGADDPSLGYDAPGGDGGALSDDSYAAPGDDYGEQSTNNLKIDK